MCNYLVAHILVEKLFYVNPFGMGCEVDRLGSSCIAVSSFEQGHCVFGRAHTGLIDALLAVGIVERQQLVVHRYSHSLDRPAWDGGGGIARIGGSARLDQQVNTALPARLWR
jgi:hypothetical protein